MKLFEILGPGSENTFSKSATPMRFPKYMDKKMRNIGAGKKVRAEKAVVRSSGKDGKFYGSRAIFQKVT